MGDALLGLDRWIQRLLGALVAAALFLMFAVIITIVVARYGFNVAIFWGEELARYTMIYMAMLGGAAAVRANQHPRLTFVVDMFPEAGRRIARILVNLLTATALLLLVWHGIDITIEEGVMRTPSLRIRYFWVYLAVPVGAGLMLLQLAARPWLPSLLDFAEEDVVAEVRE